MKPITIFALALCSCAALYGEAVPAMQAAGHARLSPPGSAEPVRSTPIPTVPVLKSPPIRCMKWDYVLNPVQVSGSENKGYQGSRMAFDGYPTSLTQPYVRTFWQFAVPTPDKPISLVVDYGKPVAVTRYVHYFERFRTPTAWRDIDILTSADNKSWQPLQSFTNLTSECPQVIAFDKPAIARYYKIVVRRLADGAPGVATHEIETYYGPTVGSVTTEPGTLVQSEPTKLHVRVVSPDVPINDATLKLVAPAGSLQGTMEIPLPAVATGSSGTASWELTPLQSGPIPVLIELHAGGFLIDQRPCTLYVSPKLAFKNVTPAGGIVTEAGKETIIKGTLTNNGTQASSNIRVTWLGETSQVEDLAPGASASFEIHAKAQPGYNEGALVATADGATTMLRRAVICPTNSDAGSDLKTGLCRQGEAVCVRKTAEGANSPTQSTLRLFASTQPATLHFIAGDNGQSYAVAVVPKAIFKIAPVGDWSKNDPVLQCTAIADDPQSLSPPFLDVELRVAVDDPKIMFRPHIDWYKVERGPHFPQLTNGHNSTTRMLCIQTADATVSFVPDTDNMLWGFTKNNEMTASFQIPLATYDPLGLGIWRPIYQAPSEFRITMPIRKGDWWDAYRHVVEDVFKFEQPRQWSMPVTQMQMLASRYLMRPESWSETWQTVRAYPFYGAQGTGQLVEWYDNFYSALYILPALQSWYLATDDPTAKARAEKVADWLLRMQHKEGPMSGGWFSVYFGDQDRSKLTGGDFVRNRWLIPHATGATTKTLLWYWNVTGRKDDRMFSAAKQGCDWLLKTMRPDGGWPYAFNLEGKALTDVCGAGQIWSTWALWRMYSYTNEDRYKDAALKSADFFRKTYMDEHRYIGYWEDVISMGGSKDKPNVNYSWETYESAIAALVFAEMGEKDLVVAAAKDTVLWSWTRVISTRQYETCYGETTEQSLCGPSQAQCPMIAVGCQQAYQLTGDPFWSDFSGAMKAMNFVADPDQAYGMVAVCGWDDPLTGVIGPPFENVRPFVTPNNMRPGDFGRQVWVGWLTAQFSWLALEWLVREADVRAPQYVKIDPETLRGTVLGAPGRIKMPEEKCDLTPFEHYDINWIGCQNDYQYALVLMNHKEAVRVAVRPHEAQLDVYTREPRILVKNGSDWKQIETTKDGIQYIVSLPEKGTAIMVWERIK